MKGRHCLASYRRISVDKFDFIKTSEIILLFSTVWRRKSTPLNASGRKGNYGRKIILNIVKVNSSRSPLIIFCYTA